ncbi:bifunctional hydroxymethylpyrimidine kinase/phosphomethylpyrimidine kinase [Hyphococcus formosus]|uniref:bifunctional hydroxymethylpyrimidine kinase/phosphomethylpyrimidine kinase n=1 Tax=Hyphococcus formosus TaxID=3143534 RepID=UPI00398B06FA
MKGRVLIIAGSDPSGGAGIQADIKAVTALGGYAMTAITALTVQNTLGVSGVHPVPPQVIKDQIDAVIGDIGADVIKIGMIGDIETAKVIETALKENAEIPVILDPVLVATSGDALSIGDVASFIRDRLLPLSYLVTPNTDEASALVGINVTDHASALTAGKRLIEKGATSALVKGGHFSGPTVEDLLISNDDVKSFTSPRIETTSTHGTGCTLASAIATGIAQSLSLTEAVERAIEYVQTAIATAPGFGAGHGPLNHCHPLKD